MNEDKKKVLALVALIAGLASMAGGRDQQQAVEQGQAFAKLADEAGLIDDLGLEGLL
jgi:hypothetical protein